jgi:hypothetical protein
MGNEADNATFTFANADRVMRELANDVDLFSASIEFSLFHVATLIKHDLWKGDVINWQFDTGAAFKVTAADGLYELKLPYPCRKDIPHLLEAFQHAGVPVRELGRGGCGSFPLR